MAQLGPWKPILSPAMGTGALGRRLETENSDTATPTFLHFRSEKAIH